MCKARTKNSLPSLGIFSEPFQLLFASDVHSHNFDQDNKGQYAHVRFDLIYKNSEKSLKRFLSHYQNGSLWAFPLAHKKRWIYLGTPLSIWRIKPPSNCCSYPQKIAYRLPPSEVVGIDPKISVKTRSTFEDFFLHFSRYLFPLWLRKIASFTTTKFIKSVVFQAYPRNRMSESNVLHFLKGLWPKRWCNRTAFSFSPEKEQKSKVFPFKT